MLKTQLNEIEQAVVDFWKDDKLSVLEEMQDKCYLLSMKGNLSYSDCFGEPAGDVERNQKYILAAPNKVIKYYNYYLLEDKTMPGEWHVGEKHNNGCIEFYRCCESLEYAFQTL